MNLKTNNMSRVINITEEKIRVAKELIVKLEEDIVDPKIYTDQMLKRLISHCYGLINSDF